VIIGIRPENLSGANASVPGRTIEAKLEIAESLGAETYLHLRTGDTPFIARVASSMRYQPDQPVIVGFDPHHLHFFDPDTGQALR
jgi:multiple sugar transport system ATP-binding protein